MRDLARRLLEATRSTGAGAAPFPGQEAQAHEAVEVCERLRSALSRFAGPDGFTSLLRRALTLARAEVPALRSVQLGTSGRIDGLEEAVSGDKQAALALAGHLLDLLVTFIGEPLTLRLVRDGFPEIEAERNDISEAE